MHYHKKQRRFRAPHEPGRMGPAPVTDDIHGDCNEPRSVRAQGKFRHSRKSRAARAAEQDLFLSALNGSDASEDSDFHDSADRRGHHKSLMLCRQVMRALCQAMAGECGDDLLRDLWVQSVQPCGGAGHLRVMIVLPAGVSPVEALLRLEHHAGRLRQAVSRAISRKRTPQLIYVPAMSMGSSTDESDALPPIDRAGRPDEVSLPADDSTPSRSQPIDDQKKDTQ